MYDVLFIIYYGLQQNGKKKKENIVVHNIGLYQLKVDVVVLNIMKNNIPDDSRVSPSTE